MSASRRSERGYSLAEAMVASGLLGMVVVGSMAGMTHSVRFTDRAEQIQSLNVAAETLLEEIRGRAFQDPVAPAFGPEAGETVGDKTTYDDVDDFCGYTENPVLDSLGAVNPSMPGVSLRVKVWHLPATDADGQSDTDVPTANDNGRMQFNLNAAAPVDACTTPGAASRFKAIEVRATSIKYAKVTSNVNPVAVRTIRFQ